jgi:hypothetical protein
MQPTTTLISALIATLALAGPAAAHAVWLQEEAAGTVKVYLGEPAQPVPPNGDPEFPKLRTPMVFAGATRAASPLTRKADHIQAAVVTDADVRAFDPKVFAPWAVRNGASHEAAVYYARLGRTEPRAVLDFEVTPTAPGSDHVTVMFKGQPLPEASVTVIDPDQWSKAMKTDAHGRLTIPGARSGRYIVEATHAEPGTFEVDGKTVSRLHHVSTLTFQKP